MDIKSLVDVENATQSRRVFWDDAVYQQEQERIFKRCWLFLTHESLIPKPGDFVTTYMGEDPVIVTRDKDGELQCFLNTCSHRGNMVCPADRGNTRSFVCSYHGWAFGLDGALINVPMEERCYHNLIDKSQLGLRPARVASYRGFVFGCFDPTAPSLEDYLGEYRWHLDSFMIGAGDGMELLGPPSKSILACNWKIPAENFVGDAYHVGWTHAAGLKMIGGPLAGLSGNRADMPFDDLGIQVTTRHGHGYGLIDKAGPGLHRNPAYDKYIADRAPIVEKALGPERARLYVGHLNMTVFPNCSMLYGTNIFKVWHPRGPHHIEIWSWPMVHKDMEPSLKKMVAQQALRTFGSAGTLESDDGENFSTATHTNRGGTTRMGRVNSTMGMQHEGPHPKFPGIVGSSFIGETSYRGFYRFWAEIMAADSWQSVRDKDATWDQVWKNRTYWEKRLAA